MKNEHFCVCCLFLPSGLLCCCATRANSDRCCHWRNVRLRDEFLWRSPSDFWCLREKSRDWEVRFWVSSIRLVRRTGLMHSSMLGAILPAILPLENESNCFRIQGEQQLPFAGTLFLVKNSAAPSGSLPIQILTCKLPLEHGLYILLSFYHPWAWRSQLWNTC